MHLFPEAVEALLLHGEPQLERERFGRRGEAWGIEWTPEDPCHLSLLLRLIGRYIHSDSCVLPRSIVNAVKAYAYSDSMTSALFM